MEERFKYIHFKSEFFYNLLILNPSNYIKLIKIQITVNVSSKRRLGQDQQNIKVVWNNLQTALPYTLTLTCFVYNENGLEEETGFVWDGRYTYIYIDPDNYEPLAQVRDWTTKDGKGVQQAHYCQNGWKS